MSREIREECVEMTGDDELLFADGFDAAIIGVGVRCSKPDIVVYDYDLCVQVLVERDGMSPSEAEEFLDFNTVGAWVGERTPIYVRRLEE